MPSYARRSISFNSSDVKEKLKRLDSKGKQAIGMYASLACEQLTATAKRNRPWTDRTGLAKQSLHSYYTLTKNGSYRITLSHGVSYGVYLEYAFEKRYAIIEPTIRTMAPNIMKNFIGLLDRL